MEKGTAGANSRQGPRKWWDRLWAVLDRHRIEPRRDSELGCSLCRRPQSVAGRLLEGCGHYICADCVAVYQAVTAEVAATSCAFCRKPAGRVRKLAGTPHVAICNECLARARLILYPPPAPVEAPPDPIPGAQRITKGLKRLGQRL